MSPVTRWHAVAGPYSPASDLAFHDDGDRRSLHVAPTAPFVPDWSPAAVAAIGTMSPVARSEHTRRRRRTMRGDRARAEVGFEEWGSGAAVRPSAAIASSAAPAAPRPPATRATRPPGDAALGGEGALLILAAERVEAVARRIRAGELRPLGLTPAMTEAGALAAALAAILAPAP